MVRRVHGEAAGRRDATNTAASRCARDSLARAARTTIGVARPSSRRPDGLRRRQQSGEGLEPIITGVTSSGSRYAIEDRGNERVLTIDGRDHHTYYTERLIRMLIERKGIDRTPLYFPFKETRGRYFLERLFAYLAGRGAAGLRVLEVGCSFGHITEYLNDQPLIATIDSFDVDPDFVEMARAQVEDLRLAKVRRLLHLTDEETTRLPFADAGFDLVLAIGVVEHLAPEGRSRHVNEWWRVVASGGHLVVLDTPNRAFPLEP